MQPTHSSLIQILQKLYARMTLFVLGFRRGQQKHRAARSHDSEIASPLYDYIDKMASKAQPTGGPDENKTAGPSNTGSTANTSFRDRAVSAHTPVSGKPRALARYFDSHKAATLLVPEVGKKLERSTWEHLHEAIRFGRMGDIKNARLHADLANGTLKEALQYMSRDEFEALLGEIEKKFDEVLAESKH